MPSGGVRAGNELEEIEAGVFEVAAQPDPAGIDEVDDGRDDLGLAGGVLGDGLHEIEQGHVLYHGPFPPWWIGLGCCRSPAVHDRAHDSAASRRTSRRKVVNPLSELMRAIRPEVTCSMRPSMRRGGCARASRWSTNARSGESWRARGPGARFASDPPLLRCRATRRTIRPAAVPVDETGVRLPLERSENAVRRGDDGC